MKPHKKIFAIVSVVAMGALIVLAPTCKKSSNSTTPSSQKKAPVSPTFGTMTDGQGNTYKTVTLGNQTWTTENLRSTLYNNGTPIIYCSDSTMWASYDSTGAYCYYNNNTTSKTKYGCLYNWFAIQTGKLAPTGWRVASDSDFRTLSNYIYNNWNIADSSRAAITSTQMAVNVFTAATLMDKSWAITEGSPLYPPYSIEANNVTGFSAIPCPLRNSNGQFIAPTVSTVGSYNTAFWLIATSLGNPYTDLNISNGGPSVGVSIPLYATGYGLSVRLVKN